MRRTGLSSCKLTIFYDIVTRFSCRCCCLFVVVFFFLGGAAFHDILFQMNEFKLGPPFLECLIEGICSKWRTSQYAHYGLSFLLDLIRGCTMYMLTVRVAILCFNFSPRLFFRSTNMV